MPQNRAYTLDELQKMGATPFQGKSSFTLEELQAGGATPTTVKRGAPVRPPGQEDLPVFGLSAPGFGLAGSQARDIAISALEPFSARNADGGFKIPDAITGTADMLKRGVKAALTGNVREGADVVKGAITAPLAPPANIASTAIGAVMGEPVDWQQTAQDVGQFINTTIPSVGGAKSSIEHFRPPAGRPRVRVPVGVSTPAGEIVEYHPSITSMAEGMGGKSSLNLMDELSSNLNEAFPDLKEAQSTYLKNGRVDTPSKFKQVAKWARERVWRQAIEPAIQGEVDLTPVADRMIDSIPDSIRTGDLAEYQRLVDKYNSQYRGVKVNAKKLQEFAQEARNEIRSALAKNSFDRSAALGTVEGKLAEARNSALRDTLYEHVQSTTGVDIRPAFKKYGALSEIEEAVGKLRIPSTLMERMRGINTYPSVKSLGAQVGKVAAEAMIADFRRIANAFDNYKLEPGRVTQPYRLQRTGIALPPVPPPTTVTGGASRTTSRTTSRDYLNKLLNRGGQK